MFKKFTAAEDISSTNIVKSSAQRAIKKDICERYPAVEPYIDDLFPKKVDLFVTKCTARLILLSTGEEPLFFQEGGPGFPYVPCLRTIHKLPVGILPRVQADKGAIKFILQGADVMAPGLTSTGGRLPDGLSKGDLVAVHVEGKECAMAVGRMVMSSEDIRSTNSGHAVETLHCLLDGLWKVPKINK